MNLVKGLLQGDKHVSTLAHSALAQRVWSRSSLAAAWQAHPCMLQAELLRCVKLAGRPVLKTVWGTMLEQSRTESN